MLFARSPLFDRLYERIRAMPVIACAITTGTSFV